MKRLIRPVRYHSFVIGPSSEANGTAFGAKNSFLVLPPILPGGASEWKGAPDGDGDWQNAGVIFWASR